MDNRILTSDVTLLFLTEQSIKKLYLFTIESTNKSEIIYIHQIMIGIKVKFKTIQFFNRSRDCINIIVVDRKASGM